MNTPRLRIRAAGFSFIAQAHPDAPQTFAAFTRLLPYRQKLIHVRWSGEAVWVPLGDFNLGVGFENHTSHPSAGDVLFYPGGLSETELLIAYGGCSFSSKMGPLAGNHFLTLVEGREHLPALGRTVLWQGAQEVEFDWESPQSRCAEAGDPPAAAGTQGQAGGPCAAGPLIA